MRVTPYSWILNQIRQGAEQVGLWVSARLRFPKVEVASLWKQFISAWSGVAVGRGMQNEPDKPLEYWLSQTPITSVEPGTAFSMTIWASYISEHLVSPWDMKLIAKVTKEGFSDYSSFRYELASGTNYRMIKEVAEGLLVKEYLRDSDGAVELHAAYVIGVLKEQY